MKNSFKEIIQQICNENGIKYKLLSKDWVIMLEKDGKRTIRELLFEFNNDYFQDKLQDSKYDIILSKYEKFQYDWKFNLSQGAIAKRLKDEELSKKLVNLAKQVCRETNLKFASVDIIETTNCDLFVLEANSGVTIDKYDKYAIYIENLMDFDAEK